MGIFFGRPVLLLGGGNFALVGGAHPGEDAGEAFPKTTRLQNRLPDMVNAHDGNFLVGCDEGLEVADERYFSAEVAGGRHMVMSWS